MPQKRLIIMNDKKADLAGPGISTYGKVNKILPDDYNPILNKNETQKALYLIKRYIEENLEKELNLQMVTCPLIVSEESGFNDMLDRDGSRTPVSL
jgi:aspartate--ammonia ligase